MSYVYKNFHVKLHHLTFALWYPMKINYSTNDVIQCSLCFKTAPRAHKGCHHDQAWNMYFSNIIAHHYNQILTCVKHIDGLRHNYINICTNIKLNLAYYIKKITFLYNMMESFKHYDISSSIRPHLSYLWVANLQPF